MEFYDTKEEHEEEWQTTCGGQLKALLRHVAPAELKPSTAWLRALPWQWVLEPMAKAVIVLRSLRQPVLPTRLNPDSSAAD